MVQKSPILLERTDKIKTVLQIPNDDRAATSRIEGFLGCNSYRGVLDAAQHTARELRRPQRRHKIDDPWSYTCQTFFGNPARLSELYMLVNWVENGLRTQLDLHFCAVSPHRQAWYRFPEDYLWAWREEDQEKNVSNFLEQRFRDSNDRHLPDDAARNAARRERFNRKPDGESFFEAVSLVWIRQMVHRANVQKSPIVLVASDGSRLPDQQIDCLIKEMTDARNAVAHNNVIRNEDFLGYNKGLIILLRQLNFDVVSAMRAVDDERSSIARKRNFGP